MRHTFTTREKVLLVILSMMLLGVAYYFIVHIPVTTRIETAQTEEANTQDSITIETIRATKMKKMQAVIDAADETDSKAEIPVYDNLEKVMVQLDSIIGSSTKDYSLTFEQISSNDGLIYRPISMSFVCSNYSVAKTILANLNNCQYRCMLDNISVDASKGSDMANTEVSVSLTITFIEKLA